MTAYGIGWHEVVANASCAFTAARLFVTDSSLLLKVSSDGCPRLHRPKTSRLLGAGG
jgi:hypothetical protein